MARKYNKEAMKKSSRGFGIYQMIGGVFIFLVGIISIIFDWPTTTREILIRLVVIFGGCVVFYWGRNYWIEGKK
jgi:hypothetical protein